MIKIRVCPKCHKIYYGADYCVKCAIETEYEFDYHPAGSTYGLVQRDPSEVDFSDMRKSRIEYGWIPPEPTDDELKVIAKVAKHGETLETLRSEAEWYESLSAITSGEIQAGQLLIAKHLRNAIKIILGYVTDEGDKDEQA